MTPRRKGFVLINSSPGMYIIHDEQKNEFDQLRSEGWRIARIRPICSSLRMKLKHFPPELLRHRAYSYSFCLLEKPSEEGRQAGRNS